MGQDNPAVKPLLLAFGENAVFKKLPENVVIPVWLFDHTGQLKFLPTKINFGPDSKERPKIPVKTGYEFVMDSLLRKPRKALEKGATRIYVCFDRGSPVNKSAEHIKRYSKIKRMDTPENYHLSEALLNDYRMPPSVTNSDQWKSFASNPQLSRRMVHYITMRMIGTRGIIDEELQKFVNSADPRDYDDDLEDFSLDHRFGASLFLHGGRLTNPDPNKPTSCSLPEPVLIEFKTVTVESGSNREIRNGSTNVRTGKTNYDSIAGGKRLTPMTTEVKRSVCINKAYPPAILNNLLEGELAVMWYAQAHMERNEDVIIVTSDIDVLMMLLLSCPDRINPATGKFVCRVFVQLVVSTFGLTRYVDVHQLWFNMHSLRPLKGPELYSTAGLKSPSYGANAKDGIRAKINGFTKEKSNGHSDPRIVGFETRDDVNERKGEGDKNSEKRKRNFDFSNGNVRGEPSKKPCYEYVTKLCAMCFLCGSDYVKGYCPGTGMKERKGGLEKIICDRLFEQLDESEVGGYGFKVNEHSLPHLKRNLEFSNMRKNLENLKSVPWVIHTFLKYYDDFEDMIKIKRYEENHVYAKMRRSCRVDIDENMFFEFTKKIYLEFCTTAEKQKRQFERKYGEGEKNATDENVRSYLYDFQLEKMEKKRASFERQSERLKNPNYKVPKNLLKFDETKLKKKIIQNRVPVKREMRVLCRNLLWQMEYSMNGYKHDCSMIDPTTLYNGLPYYGWILKGSKCSLASRVSIKRKDIEEIKRENELKKRTDIK